MAFALEEILPDLHNSITQLGKRTSYDKAVKHLGEDGDIAAASEALEEKIKAVPQLETELAGLKETLKDAKEALGDVSKIDKDGEYIASGNQKAFDEAKKAYDKAQNGIRKLLNGETTIKDVPLKERNAISSAFGALEERVEAVQGCLDGVFARVKLDGFNKTVGHNMNFWEKGATKNRGIEFAGRYASVAAGAGLTIDALARGKKKDDECRSVVGRIIEGATGVALVGGGLIAGHAR